MQGPSSYNVVTTIQVIAGQPDTGVFIYNGSPGRGTLIAAAVGAGGTDPSGGNTVSPVLAVGQWSASTGLPGGQSMVDQFGNLTVQGTDGVARLRIFTGADGITGHNAGSVRWLNDFGAVIQLIDPTVSATVQYRDLGSATQGGVLGAQVAGTSDIIDPITGVVLHPGITLIDPIFGDNLSIQGDVVGFDQLGMTRKCFISSQDPSGVTNAPFLQVDAPEHTAALHWQGLYFGETQDGTTHPPKAIFCTQAGNGNAPSIKTNDFLELQPVSGQNAIQAFMQTATDNALDTRVTGDTFDRLTVNGTSGLAFGSGAAATDVSFGRPNTVGFLRVTGGLQVTNLIELFNQPAGTIVIELVVGTETTSRYQQDNTGKQFWGPGGGSATDTTVARVGVGQLNVAGSSAANTYLFSVSQGASSVGGISVTMQSTGDFANAIYVSGDTTAAPRVVSTGLSDIRFGPGGSTAPDTTLTRSGVGILDLVSVLRPADTSAPATPSGHSSIWSKTGQLMYTSEDGNAYHTGMLHVTSYPAQTINSASFTNVTGASALVAALHYRFTARVILSENAAAGAPQFQFTCPTTSGNSSIIIKYFKNVGVQTFSVRDNVFSTAQTALGTAGGPAMTSQGQVVEIEGDATFASAGTLQLQALTSVAADTFTINVVYIDLYPNN